MKLKGVMFVILLVVVGIMFSYSVISTPSGADVSAGTPERPSSGAAQSVNAQAGNVTSLVVTSSLSVTQTWQGFYGNVSGGLRLADASGSVFYNWSLVSPQGEVYASVNNSITWPNIQCFNFTAVGNYSNEDGNGGTTNLYGANLTTLQTRYGINESDLDSVNQTFSGFNHDSFFTSSQEFSADECRSVQLYNSTAQPQDGLFEEVLLYEPSTTSVIFASLLEDSTAGFNSQPVDFQMMVLEDGHGADTTATAYFFFVELE